jgi:23S rRNA (cytosine1962-C5)-methyltransferase
MLVFGEVEPEPDLLARRIGLAVARRAGCPLIGETDALRLVNAEGDGLPGLVVDRFADWLVVRPTSAGMWRRREEIAAALREAVPGCHAVLRVDPRSARQEGIPAEEGPLFGPAQTAAVAIRERDRDFEVDVQRGQKTGFYLDQRDARDLVARLAAGRRVLDLFCYTGGFGVAAGRGGAREVMLVDSSREAVEQALSHMSRNAPDCATTRHVGDAFAFVRKVPAHAFDLVVDPPPLARHRAEVPRATRAYKDVMLHAFAAAAEDALALVFSCSHHVGPELFRKVVFGAALDARRPLQVLRELGAPADHPVSIDHPEGHYLSGLLVRL